MKEIHYFYVPGGGELCELPVEEARHAISAAPDRGRPDCHNRWARIFL